MNNIFSCSKLRFKTKYLTNDFFLHNPDLVPKKGAFLKGHKKQHLDFRVKFFPVNS